MKKIFLASLLLLATACSDDDTSIDGLFIPNVSNQWTSDRNSIFFFTTEQSNVSESTFTGNEQPLDNDDVYQLEGSFKNHDIEYTFTSGPETGVKYTGKFIEGASLKVKATGSNGKKVEITRN